ncbi:hypothetical protein [Pelagicoccus sp. SDUM812002]|uniref:hypothetical protein n=1 Tax=Pelagicoccus sp. SDUM812002 TaxID=3041266 RepID=UPI00280F9314|nr:hypothetical protein [Pelagicoccus sp. SDUM812002]MDQ8184791.1 hypothetical protein [Pelagicoccus sp. SDUM812002]
MAQKTPTPKNDERNIVGSNQVEIQDLEDQVVMFWEKNKGIIIGSVAFTFAVFLGYQGIQWMQQNAEQSLKAGYQEADTADAKAAWAAEEAGTPLSGFAFKELGDQAYATGELSKAEGYYRQAVDSAAAPIDQAAKIALAVTLIGQDKLSEAKDLLQGIADDPTALAQAEAQYRLAYIASQEGDAATARALIEAISDDSFFWKSRARSIEQKLPDA